MLTKIWEPLLQKSRVASRMRLALALVILPAAMAFPRPSIAASADIVLACTAPALNAQRVAVDGAQVVAAAQTPMAVDNTSTAQPPPPKEVSSITLNEPTATESGQLLIASLITLNGPIPTITAPSGWQLIREDTSATTRQSLYYHFAAANEAPPEWKFSQGVYAQGVMLVLDDVWATDPLDGSSGIAGPKDQTKAPALTTTDDGDLILDFFATDFAYIDPGPTIPPNLIPIVNEVTDTDPYWILASYQSQRGDVPEVDAPTPQLYNVAAAQVAVRRR